MKKPDYYLVKVFTCKGEPIEVSFLSCDEAVSVAKKLNRRGLSAEIFGWFNDETNKLITRKLWYEK